MRYITKNINSAAAILLNNWNRLRRIAGQKLAYDDFENKKCLNTYLIEEQGGICCYCQQKITKLKIGGTGDCHNEHLLPQRGPNAREDKQTDHGNIFACCSFSNGLPKHLQHCGEAKHDEVIYEFIKWIDCNSHFKYNLLGEITPIGGFTTIQEFENNIESLSYKQKMALDAIEKLKLNQSVLKNERKKDIGLLIKVLNKLTIDEVQEKINEINGKPYLRFVDMMLFYMKQKK